LQTDLDPSLSRGDRLSGSIAGKTGELPEASEKIKFKLNLFEYVIGTAAKEKLSSIHTNDALMITAAVAKTVGIVISASNLKGEQVCEMKLKIPICVEKDDKIAISKQISGRWHLVGWGVVA
jgi:translation initiation factor 2 subunit 3